MGNLVEGGGAGSGAEGETGAKKKKKKGVGVRGKFFLRFYLKMAFHSSESVSNLNSVLQL